MHDPETKQTCSLSQRLAAEGRPEFHLQVQRYEENSVVWQLMFTSRLRDGFLALSYEPQPG